MLQLMNDDPGHFYAKPNLRYWPLGVLRQIYAIGPKGLKVPNILTLKEQESQMALFFFLSASICLLLYFQTGSI